MNERALTLRLSEEQYQALRREAFETERKISDIVREAIEQRAARDERDAALAVIAKAREALESATPRQIAYGETVEPVLRILAAVDTSALDERDAAAHAEVIDWIDARGYMGSYILKVREHFGLSAEGTER